MPRLQKRERKMMTLKLLPEDREAIQSLGRDTKPPQERYFALLELVPIVAQVKLPEPEDRRPLRLGIPDELVVAIERRQKESGHSFVSILLHAAREYQVRHKPGV